MNAIKMGERLSLFIKYKNEEDIVRAVRVVKDVIGSNYENVNFYIPKFCKAEVDLITSDFRKSQSQKLETPEIDVIFIDKMIN